jgi:hypothetical protein
MNPRRKPHRYSERFWTWDQINSGKVDPRHQSATNPLLKVFPADLEPSPCRISESEVPQALPPTKSEQLELLQDAKAEHYTISWQTILVQAEQLQVMYGGKLRDHVAAALTSHPKITEAMRCEILKHINPILYSADAARKRHIAKIKRNMDAARSEGNFQRTVSPKIDPPQPGE